MSYNIIVARYNENINWLMDEIDNCIIYNKGKPLNIPNEIILENVGRESDTYLNYIITHYDSLPDIVVFTQAKISDHRGTTTYFNPFGIDDITYLIQLKNEAFYYSKSNNIYIHYDKGLCIHFDKEWNVRHNTYFLSDNYKNNKPITFIEWFKTHINEHYPNPIHIYLNGIFAVKKELILKHSLEYYKQLILEVNHHINSTEGHFFERSWYYIFAES